MQSVRFVLNTVCPIRTICPPLIKAVCTICLRMVCPRQIRAKKQSVQFVIRTISLQRFCCFSMCPKVMLLDESDIALFAFKITIPLEYFSPGKINSDHSEAWFYKCDKYFYWKYELWEFVGPWTACCISWEVFTLKLLILSTISTFGFP